MEHSGIILTIERMGGGYAVCTQMTQSFAWALCLYISQGWFENPPYLITQIPTTFIGLNCSADDIFIVLQKGKLTQNYCILYILKGLPESFFHSQSHG